jgi:hypothetical protein
MQAHPALVLNADFRPLSYFPLSLLSWQDAITAVFGMGFECSAIRQYGRSTDRAIGVAWKAIGWFATADRDRGLPPVWRVNRPGCRRRLEDGWDHWSEIRVLGSPPNSVDHGCTGDMRVSSKPRTFDAG